MNKHKSSLIIVRGYPGQGKTTFANSAFSGCVKFENDMFFMHNGVYEYSRENIKDAISWCINCTRNCLENNIDVVVSNTFCKKRFVDSYKRLADLYDSNFKVYRMMGNFKSIHDIPDEVFNNMKNGFEDYDDEYFVYPSSLNKYDIINFKR